MNWHSHGKFPPVSDLIGSQDSLLRDGNDLESATPFESLSAKQQGRFQQETWPCWSRELRKCLIFLGLSSGLINMVGKSHISGILNGLHRSYGGFSLTMLPEGILSILFLGEWFLGTDLKLHYLHSWWMVHIHVDFSGEFIFRLCQKRISCRTAVTGNRFL